MSITIDNHQVKIHEHAIKCDRPNAYSREDGMFCHALFTRDVDAAFSVPGLEKEPLASKRNAFAQTKCTCLYGHGVMLG